VENTPNVGGNVVANVVMTDRGASRLYFGFGFDVVGDVVMTDRASRLYFGFGFGFEHVYNRAKPPIARRRRRRTFMRR